MGCEVKHRSTKRGYNMTHYKTAAMIGALIVAYVLSLHGFATVYEFNSIEGGAIETPYIPDAAGIARPILIQA